MKHHEITGTLRTEYWLQTWTKRGKWEDCGQYKTAAAVSAEMVHLKRNNPNGTWQCIERTIVEREIDVFNGRHPKNGKK